ncbi:hypothetical protein T08_2244 [Trichinella sp. T8]|nr:hypothetical protein T08_2244 [Trichinella sp. T8]
MVAVCNRDISATICIQGSSTSGTPLKRIDSG